MTGSLVVGKWFASAAEAAAAAAAAAAAFEAVVTLSCAVASLALTLATVT